MIEQRPKDPRPQEVVAADALRVFGIESPTAAQIRAATSVRTDLARVLLGSDDPAASAGVLMALTVDLDLPPRALTVLGQRLERSGWKGLEA